MKLEHPVLCKKGQTHKSISVSIKNPDFNFLKTIKFRQIERIAQSNDENGSRSLQYRHHADCLRVHTSVAHSSTAFRTAWKTAQRVKNQDGKKRAYRTNDENSSMDDDLHSGKRICSRFLSYRTSQTLKRQRFNREMILLNSRYQ